MDRHQISKSTDNTINPFALHTFLVDSMSFYLVYKGDTTSDCDCNVGTATSYKKGCVDCLGNLACGIRGLRLDLDRAVKPGIEFSLLELPPED